MVTLVGILATVGVLAFVPAMELVDRRLLGTSDARISSLSFTEDREGIDHHDDFDVENEKVPA